ncbi:patatin-like phospholipase family protein [Massilia terrae]|uniref:Patatin-like phospholipase family protein n=1 Tax=Massilia terrae TaxID=1811224 RepID=A0ABT2CSP3_9BURK|nr:patatin-like phospholipase family protein [Massilia terrae]MCS0657001.1 patatin-like phospholipase family protein [Massilia terrae]
MADTTGSPTAWVLAGGGSFGAIQVGMLQALVAYGLVPDLVVGSSVGAINGAYFAGAPDADGLARLAAIWCGMRRSTVFPLAWGSLLRLKNGDGSTVDPSGLSGLLERCLPYQALEDARIAVHMVATNQLGGGTVTISRGPVVEAVLASCAIPAVFPPVRIGEHFLIDGAIASNTPISVALELGARRMIVLPTGFACALEAPPRGAIASILHAVTLVIAHQLASEFERCQGLAQIIMVPPLCPLAASPYDFSHAADLIQRAADQTRRWLDKGGLTRSQVAPALLAHSH